MKVETSLPLSQSSLLIRHLLHTLSLSLLKVNSILANVPDLKDPMSYYMEERGNMVWVAVSGKEVAGRVGVRIVGEGAAEIKRMQVMAEMGSCIWKHARC